MFSYLWYLGVSRPPYVTVKTWRELQIWFGHVIFQGGITWGVCRHPLQRKEFLNKNTRIDSFFQEISLLLLSPNSKKTSKAQPIGKVPFKISEYLHPRQRLRSTSIIIWSKCVTYAAAPRYDKCRVLNQKNYLLGNQKIALRQLGHLLFRGCRLKRYSPVAVYPTEKHICTENQKIALRQLGHHAFRGCTSKRYSPVAVYPTEKNIYTEKRKLLLVSNFLVFRVNIFFGRVHGNGRITFWGASTEGKVPQL